MHRTYTLLLLETRRVAGREKETNLCQKEREENQEFKIDDAQERRREDTDTCKGQRNTAAIFPAKKKTARNTVPFDSVRGARAKLTRSGREA
jgi:hypothetical protein